MKFPLFALGGAGGALALLVGAGGFQIAAFAGCLVAAIAAGYGAWRFWLAYRLTGSRLALGAGAVSLVWPLAAVGTVAAGADGLVQAGALSSAGAVAGAGFGLSRSQHRVRLRLGLWLPHAIAAWRRGEVAPLEQMLEATIGESAAAHAARTAALAHTLAEPLILGEDEVKDLVLAALIHPLGATLAGEKVTCPPARGSAERATRMLERIPVAAGAADVLRDFEERWDGAGPRGVAGENLLIGSRILAVIEAFDRASEAGLDAALAEVRAGSGGPFDPVVAGELVYLFRARTPIAAA